MLTLSGKVLLQLIFHLNQNNDIYGFCSIDKGLTEKYMYKTHCHYMACTAHEILTMTINKKIMAIERN